MVPLAPMGWDQLWSWIGKEISTFGLRWIVLLIMGIVFSGWFGRRYKEMKRRVSELESEKGSKANTTVFYNYNTITNNPPDMGDVNAIKTMTQSEYDALPSPDEQTLYLIVDPSG